MSEQQRWTIGELARASGVTVRTLHHYDDIGLLTAGERTAAGHRRYTPRDLRRLYRIRALRTLGLSLEEIADLLADAPDDLDTLRELLKAQLRALETQAGRIQHLTRHITELLGRVDESTAPGPFLETLELMSMFETYFTEDEREQLARRRGELGPDQVEEAKARWTKLVEELLSHMDNDTPVDDPRVHELVTRWDAIATPFHTGEQTKTAARRMWLDHGGELARNLPWPTEKMTALVTYLERARHSAR
ncbi:MerR family transcriptional regulator [Amycolatopsis sp. GM8]|uniref:MerR family transcriptional regulator n=1 Tax=Amycolatopsis sp. GM8 TaxID=2896530 RepID=UPI001F3E4520|nr:MerR family transcriptional regulator [Amycolatopsis sp. GM8]